MKSMVRTMGLAAALAFAAVPAQAQDLGWYAGGGLGMFTLDSGVGSDTVLGGYASLGADVNENVGAELRLGKTGTGSTPAFGFNVNYGIDYFLSAFGKVQFPVTGDLNLYGLLGFTYAKASASVSSPVLLAGVRNSGTNTSFSFGLGGDYRFTDNLRAGLEWVAYASDVSGLAATIKFDLQ
ncbi:MAG TPA: porin family protein [Mariprofundaceae bacterium]|nr:porin family protein [Mariprofundaceae bacterium]